MNGGQQWSDYGQPSQGNLNFVSTSFDPGRAQQSQQASYSSYAPNQAGSSFDDEPPLLEELGIDITSIFKKTGAVFSFGSTADGAYDSDLSGPIVFIFGLGFSHMLVGSSLFSLPPSPPKSDLGAAPDPPSPLAPPPSPSLQGRQSPVRAHHRVDHHLLPRNVLAGELAGRARRRHRDVRLLQHFGLLPRAPNFLGSLQPRRGKVGRSFDSRGLLHPLEHAGGFEVCRGALESEAHTRGGAKVSLGLPMAPHLQHVRSAFRLLTQWEGVNPGSRGENTK